MNRHVRATLAASVVAIAGLVVIAVWFGALNWFGPGRDYTSWPGQIRVELMPSDSVEYLERHYPGPNGKDLKTDIEYRNGDSGEKLYREDNTLRQWDVDYSDGVRRLHAEYAKDGRQVVLGYEHRKDRTLQWKASSKDGVVETTTYYYDGTTAFSVVQLKIGDTTTDAQHFRKSGKPWVHQIGSTYNPKAPSLEEVWNADGHLVYARKAGEKDGVTVTYYRPDGTALYKQTWRTYQSPYSGGDGYPGEGYTPSQTVLRSIEQYADDGQTVTRLIEKTEDGTSISVVTTFGADRSRVVYSVAAAGNITHVDKHDKDGRVIDSEHPKPGQVKLDIPAELQKEIPTAIVAIDFWTEQEKDASKRGNDAP